MILLLCFKEADLFVQMFYLNIFKYRCALYTLD